MKTVQSKNDRKTLYNIYVFYDLSPTNPDKLASICATSWRSVTASGFFTSACGMETGVKPEAGWLETGSFPGEVDEEDMTDVGLDWLCDWFTGVICNEDPPGLIKTKIKRCPWKVYRILSVQIKDLSSLIITTKILIFWTSLYQKQLTWIKNCYTRPFKNSTCLKDFKTLITLYK